MAEHRIDEGDPVVGLVVEDAMGQAVRHRLPRPHELGAVGGGISTAAAELLVPGRGPRAAPTTFVERPGERPRARQSAPCAPGAWFRAARRRPPPRTGLGPRHLRVHRRRPGSRRDRDALSGQRRGDLVAEGLAAFDREAVLVALAGKRQGAFRDRRLQAVIGRVSRRHPPRRRQTVISAPSARQPVDDGGLGVSRHEHEQPPAAGGGDHRRRQGGVAAAGDRERREAGPRSSRAP